MDYIPYIDNEKEREIIDKIFTILDGFTFDKAQQILNTASNELACHSVVKSYVQSHRQSS